MDNSNTSSANDSAGLNPYAAPVDVEDAVESRPVDLTIKQTTFGNALLRWSIICVVSAAPSFFYGCFVTQGRVASITAMLVGVAVFAIAYAWIDTRPFWRRWMAEPTIRKAIIGVFGLRIGISIVFPVGIINDTLAGMMSLGVVSWLTQQVNIGENRGLTTLPTFATTVIQGVILNAELYFVGLMLYGLIAFWNNFRATRV